MAEYVEKGTLHETIAKLEKLARDRYLDTPWDSPVRTRYQEQPNERMNLKHLIFDLPAADVAPVVHGRWSKFYKSGNMVEEGFVSSCCDMWNERRSPYCPNCGARMDGDG